ncbi:beta-lactamase/transpeptidase-like protein [Tothia fuscella]|uniref:Beta-lactamase/transpeptidase-like protein n=1 Tax=Tothia fuscella TaxID=1048955 RepID=A0A9P4NF65_9PEZI|nr:beta-lactamase/transpeptidase-like protein [Tothia fuscella]
MPFITGRRLQVLAVFGLVTSVLATNLLGYSWQTNSQHPLNSKRHAFNASHFDQVIHQFMEARSLPGLSVALTFDDRLIYASGFGYADKEHDQFVQTTDRFRLASVSKSVTAIAIMNLVENGALSLSDTVFGNNGILGHTYGKKEFSPWEKEITVQHLLEHTTGFVNENMCAIEHGVCLPDNLDPTYAPRYLDLDQWDLITALLDAYDPSHKPGTFANYSNFGYFIAGRVVEAVSGVMPYEKYVKDDILTPLGITDMDLATDVRQEHEAVYYDTKDPHSPYSFHVNRRDSVGAWIATPTSLVKILTAIDFLSHKPNILNTTTRNQMFNQSNVNGSTFAKGWTVRYENGVLSGAYKDGGYSGTNSYININFLNKTSYAIVTNQELPYKGHFKGALDLKSLMGNLTFQIEEWPSGDLFEKDDAP